jgi:phage terminase large subunit-like protein
VPFKPTIRGLYALARALGVDLPEFHRIIARAAFGPEREAAVVLPRGQGKSTLIALIALHHLLSVPDASVSVGAASREQGAIVYGIMRELAAHPAIRDLLVVRHLAFRTDSGGRLRVVSGKGERAHGQTDSLAIAEEVWNWSPTGGLLGAFQTGLIKRPDSRLLIVSTAANRLHSPLGELRSRAMSGEVKKDGFRIDALAPGLRWVEWSVPDGLELTPANVKRANPAPWISVEALAEQQHRVTPGDWAQFHAGKWGVSDAAWLPVGAWSAAREMYAVEEGERVWCGVDVGGSRAASALVAVTADLRVVHAEAFEGNESVMQLPPAIRKLAETYRIQEVAYDPWRFQSEAIRLREDGVRVVEFPQSGSRMIPASEGLHAAVVEQRLRHRGFPALDRHVAAAVARQAPGGRGWRLDKTDLAAQIDLVVALAMAVERASVKMAPVRLVGWL